MRKTQKFTRQLGWHTSSSSDEKSEAMEDPEHSESEAVEDVFGDEEESGASNNLPHRIFPMGLLLPELMHIITGYAGAAACAYSQCDDKDRPLGHE